MSDRSVPHEPSRWRAHLGEFLMTFLAITLGFFVENYRESQSERAQERVLMAQVIEELREDQLAADSNIVIREWRRAKLDSLLDLHRAGTAVTRPAEVYYFAQIVRNRYMFVPHTGAFAQLDGGGLRLVTNQRVLRAIQRNRTLVDDMSAFNATSTRFIRTVSRAGGELAKLIGKEYDLSGP